MIYRTFILRSELNARQLWQFLKANWLSCAQANKPLAVTVEEHKAKRSDAQNRLYWRLLADIAEHCWIDGRQFSKEAWRAHFAGEFIGWEETPGGRRAPISTTTLGVAEFTAYIERIQEYAATELALEAA